MKKVFLSVIIVFMIVLILLIGRYIYKLTIIEPKSDYEIAKTEKIEDGCTAEYEYYKEIKETISKEEKISPNAELIMNTYYSGCEHTVTKTEKIDSKYVNLTKEEFMEKMNEWNVKEFSPNKIVVYKENDGICDEHYVVKEKDGFVVIYSLDDAENETLKETTEVSTSFLTDEDISKLKDGIKVYGKENLNSVLEDLE